MTVTALSTSPSWCPRGHCHTEMDAMLALGEAITKGYTVTPEVWECDLCGWFHFGAVRRIPDRCKSTSKVPFPTEEDARSALAARMLAAANGNVRRTEKGIYHCRFCSRWHLTSNEEGK